MGGGTATCHPSLKPSKEDEQNMLGIAAESGNNSLIDPRVLPEQQTHIHQVCADTGCLLEDLPGGMEDWEGCER